MTGSDPCQPCLVRQDLVAFGRTSCPTISDVKSGTTCAIQQQTLVQSGYIHFRCFMKTGHASSLDNLRFGLVSDHRLVRERDQWLEASQCDAMQVSAG